MILLHQDLQPFPKSSVLIKRRNPATNGSYNLGIGIHLRRHKIIPIPKESNGPLAMRGGRQQAGISHLGHLNDSGRNQCGFVLGFFLSYEIALVIFAEQDIKFAIYVALSLSSVFHRQKKKKHFTAIFTSIIDN